MNALQQVRELREAGRFTEALRDISGLSTDRTERLPADVLRAELLERTGKHAQSRSLMETLVRRQGISLSDRSVCEFVLARLDLEDREFDAAMTHLQRSIALAAQVPDLERMCWSQLRLLLLLSDRSGPEAIIPLLGELRANVTKLGHPPVTAALHVTVAQMEAQRGLIVNAQRHLDLGLSCLVGFENLWLKATAENVMACIEMMRSNFDAGFNHARQCLSMSEESGAASVHVSALGNLGNLAYLTGRFDEAVDYSQRARSALRPTSDNWNACLETLARINLAQGRLDECAELLDQIDESVTSPKDRSRYVHRHTQLTRTQLLDRTGNLRQAIAHADLVLTLAAEAGDHLLHNATLLTKAGLLQAAGKISEALSVLDTIAPTMANQPPDFFAHYETILASALVSTGNMQTAGWHRRRAERTYKSLGHVPGALEVTRRLQAAIRLAHDVDLEDTAARHLGPPSAVVSDIASIMLHAGRPDLVAREIVDLLESVGCVRYATAVARAADGSTTTIAETGEPRDQTATPECSERRLAIGSARGREIYVLVGARPDIESAATVNAVVMLLTTLHEIERARVEREERATLWPVDELPIENDDAVATGHMRQTMSFARKIANANVTVLITGESGTGKELVARAVHTYSSRAQKPFIPFNCAAVPRDMLESQLFGHRRGAFTGADRDNPGVVRSARDGTLFLDEIGELSPELQPKLLRFLESGEICPLGESTPFTVDVRIIAATNANLDTLVRDGRFREDLFYRLNVVHLEVKPLRERRDEIPALANHFVRRAAEESRKGHVRLAEETMERLLLYSWPGNVRQLHNEIRRMVAFAEPNSMLDPDAISIDIVRATPTSALPHPAVRGQEIAVPLTEKLHPTLSRIECEMIKAALRDHHGKVDATAKALGISRKGLYLKRQRLGL